MAQGGWRGTELPALGTTGQTEVPTSPRKAASTLLLKPSTPSLLPGKLPPNTSMSLTTHEVPKKHLGDAVHELLTPGHCWIGQPPAGRSPAALRSLQGGSGQDANKQQEARERQGTSRPNEEIQDKQRERLSVPNHNRNHVHPRGAHSLACTQAMRDDLRQPTPIPTLQHRLTSRKDKKTPA